MFKRWIQNDERFLCSKLFLFFLLTAGRVKGFNASSHKSEPTSSIPWNILLDPSFTSHKTSSSVSKNQVVFSPPSYGQSSALLHHQLSYRPPSTQTTSSYASQIFYSPAPPSSTTTERPKYSIPIPNHYDDYSQVADSHQTSAFLAVRSPFLPKLEPQASNQVTFPETDRHKNAYISNIPSERNKVKSAAKKSEEIHLQKNKKRKPEDYFDFEEGDGYFQDYDDLFNYPFEGDSAKDQRYPTSHLSPGSRYPSGVPSGSNSLQTNAKDGLKSGVHIASNYGGPSDYYAQQRPSTSYSDYAPQRDSYPGYFVSYDSEPSGGTKHSNDEYGMDTSQQYYNPSHDYFEHMGGGGGGNSKYDAPVISAQRKKGSKFGPLAFALGLLPLGLLLASLVPTVVTIPVTTAVATGRKRKRREIKFFNPVLDTIDKYGVASLEDPMCLQRMFCSVVVEGKQNRSSIIQKIYYKGATLLNEDWADYIGLKMLLRAVKRDHCELFPCSGKESKRFPKPT